MPLFGVIALFAACASTPPVEDDAVRALAGCYRFTFAWDEQRDGAGIPPGDRTLELTTRTIALQDRGLVRRYSTRLVNGSWFGSSVPPDPLTWAPIGSGAGFTMSNYNGFHGLSVTMEPAHSGFTGTAVVTTDVLVERPDGALSGTVARGTVTAVRVHCE